VVAGVRPVCRDPSRGARRTYRGGVA